MSEPQQPEQDKREENWVVVVDQTSLHRRGVESKPSTPANEPRTPWLPAVKSAKHSETKYTSKPDTKGKHRKQSLRQLKRSETSQEELPVVPSDIQEKSDEEEAGGLSRTESRASRVSRAVRQLFCCGVPYEPPEEDNISCHRAYAI